MSIWQQKLDGSVAEDLGPGPLMFPEQTKPLDA